MNYMYDCLNTWSVFHYIIYSDDELFSPAMCMWRVIQFLAVFKLQLLSLFLFFFFSVSFYVKTLIL